MKFIYEGPVKIIYSKRSFIVKHTPLIEVEAKDLESAKREILYKCRKKYGVKDYQDVYLQAPIIPVD